MAVNVTKRVTGKVTSLSITRDGAKIKASWKIPASMTSDSRADRAEWLDAEVDFVREGVPSKSSGEIWYTGASAAPSGAKYLDCTDYDYNWIKGVALNTSVEKPYDRSRFHPVSQGRYCKKVNVGVHGGNSSGVGGWDEHSLTASGRGPIAWATYEFKKPRKPTVSWDYDASTAKATVTVETNAGADAYERRDTMVCVTVTKQDGTVATNLAWASTTSTSWTRTVDLSGYITNLQAGKSVTVTCKAYARGMAGDSDTVTGERTVAMPVAAVLGAITCDRKAATGRIKVAVTPGKWTAGVQLQRRSGESGSWSDVSGAADDGNAKALYDSYGDASPADGTYTYYRVKSTRDNYTVYSEAKRADCIFTEKAPLTCGATCAVVSAIAARAGTSATVVMGYNDTTSNTGSELSWSDDPDAWNSTSGPYVSTFTGDDASRASDDWAATRTVTVSSLSVGTTYYARTRRYRTSSDETAYSEYSEVFSFRLAGAADDECAIVSATPVTDAECELVIGIDEDTANTGTEVSWSSYEHAWESNLEPSSLLATWDLDSASRSSSWDATQTVYLAGLEPGTLYYVRARRYLESTSGTTHSDWSAIASFRMPATGVSSDVRCGLVSVDAGDDGASATVVVGWEGQHTGCEVSWSPDPDAWGSTTGPETATFDWADEESQSTAWGQTSTLRINGLAEGTTYYVRARSYYEGASTAWSAYTAHGTVTPVSAPAAVALSAPAAVARGEAIPCTWAIEGELDQAEWHIHEASTPLASLADGAGTLCRTQIPADRYGDGDSVEFYVECGCGGGLTASNPVTVGIADAPELSASCDAEVDAQPVTLSFACSDPSATLLVTVRADGVTVAAPEGDRDQLPGDAVWTAALAPEWEASGDAYAAEVELPVCELWDGASYTVEAVAVEPVAGLRSDAAEAAFSVEYAHQAPEPALGTYIDVDPFALSTRIALAAPSGAGDGDCYDIYRSTPTGHVLVAEGLALDATVVDPYAPYGRDVELGYRICCRTPDGDFAFDDFAYELDSPALRVDFDGDHVELPYNGSLSSSHHPSRTTRAHADGNVGGYYEPAVEKEGTYETTVRRISEDGQLEAVQRLADRSGPCFMRFPDGTAMQCGVDVDLDQDGASWKTPRVRLSYTREALTDAFAVKTGEGV